MKRVPTPELLDTDSGTPSEIAASLSDLHRINRWFGGIGVTRHMLQRITGERMRTLSLLEVAAGSGHTPQLASRALERNGIHVNLTFMDRAPTHLRPSSRSVAGNVLALPFRDGSFDAVSSVLFVHHLSPDELVQFAREALRVCRVAMIINDIVRSPIHLALVYAGTPLYRSRLTRHDAPASVRQAYTPDEIRDLVQQAGPSRIDITRHYLFRMGVIAWK
jgi:hypothetical protein